MNLWDRLRGHKRARRTIWVPADGRKMPIGTMSRAHLVNALAMVMNKSMDLGVVWVHRGVRGLRYLWPDKLVKELTDRRKNTGRRFVFERRFKLFGSTLDRKTPPTAMTAGISTTRSGDERRQQAERRHNCGRRAVEKLDYADFVPFDDSPLDEAPH